MNPSFDSSTSAFLPASSVEHIRALVNIAQSECVCHSHLSVCLLTATGERAGIQPFLYEAGTPA